MENQKKKKNECNVTMVKDDHEEGQHSDTEYISQLMVYVV